MSVLYLVYLLCVWDDDQFRRFTFDEIAIQTSISLR